MNPTEDRQSKYATTNQIWRFFSDAAHQWHWERLSFNGTVLESSATGYPQYEDCLAKAAERGYVLPPSLTTKAEKTSPRTKRPYIRFSSR